MILDNPIPIVTEKELNFNSIVLYMDLDAFFASVEIREQPKLKGLPIIIGGDPITKRGVVSTCSYEARKFGIHSGMPISQAVKLCPEVRIVKSTHGLYSKVSKNIMKIIGYYSPKIKVSGVDEAYLDLFDLVSDYEEAEKLAYELKDDIYASEKITCSIGLAPNKILAKIASGVDKPDGLKIVKPFEIVDFLAPLKISIIPGVGKKSESSFNKEGVYTCGDLKNLSVSKVVHNWGKSGLKLWKLVNGYNTEEMSDDKFSKRDRKSISDERTFFNPLTKWKDVWYYLNDSIKTIVSSAQKKNMQYRTITLKIRFRNFKTDTRSHTIPCYCDDEKSVRGTVKKLLFEYKDVKPSDIRLIGVKISNIRKIIIEQRTLEKFFNK